MVALISLLRQYMNWKVILVRNMLKEKETAKLNIVSRDTIVKQQVMKQKLFSWVTHSPIRIKGPSRRRFVVQARLKSCQCNWRGLIRPIVCHGNILTRCSPGTQNANKRTGWVLINMSMTLPSVLRLLPNRRQKYWNPGAVRLQLFLISLPRFFGSSINNVCYELLREGTRYED